MQRSKSLISLSHDHHHGLVLARRIVTDLKYGRIRQADGYVLAFWETDLKRHFEDEERFVFPLLPATDEGVLQAVSEHQQLYKYVVSMKEGGEEAEMAASLKAFAALLREHIRFEERVLFVHVEETSTKEALAAIGRQLHE